MSLNPKGQAEVTSVRCVEEAKGDAQAMSLLANEAMTQFCTQVVMWVLEIAQADRHLVVAGSGNEV
jgi:hypothetical protein